MENYFRPVQFTTFRSHINKFTHAKAEVGGTLETVRRQIHRVAFRTKLLLDAKEETKKKKRERRALEALLDFK